MGNREHLKYQVNITVYQEKRFKALMLLLRRTNFKISHEYRNECYIIHVVVKNLVDVGEVELIVKELQNKD